MYHSFKATTTTTTSSAAASSSTNNKRKRIVSPYITEIADISETTVLNVGRLGSKKGAGYKQQQQQQQSQSIIEPTSKNLLQQFLSPLDTDTFLAKCFRKCAVYIPSTRHDRASALVDAFNELDPEWLYHNTASENIFVWMQDASTNRIQSIEVSDPDAAAVLHKCGGHATYCRAPPHIEQALVGTMLQNTGLACGQYNSDNSNNTLGRGEVEVFVSSRNDNALTDWHYDFQENFTIQLTGCKEWTVQRAAAEMQHPLRACTPHYQASDVVESQIKSARLYHSKFVFDQPVKGKTAVGETETVRLKAGDCFYFPAGMWHKVRTIEPGVSINISLMATNYAALTCQAFQHVLLKRPEWRQCIVNNNAEHAVAHLQQLLQELPAIIQELCTQGGAEAILPTSMQHNYFNDLKQDRIAEKGHEDEVGSDDDSVEEVIEDHFVVDADSFQMPDLKRKQSSGTKNTTTTILSRLKAGKELVLNPLASLIAQADIEDYYKSTDDGSDEDDSHDGKASYVLNVNYAGNEAHESLIRIVLRGDAYMLSILANLDKITHEVVKDLIHRSPAAEHILNCLSFYGYYVWKNE